MSNFSFGNIILAGSGKKGILTPDDTGYYTLNAGGFNVKNRNGISYTANRYIQECMSDDSDLKRRVRRGEVYAECGHPQMFFYERVNGVVVRTAITDLFTWIKRLKTIEMDRACGHIREIHFDASQWTAKGGGPIYNTIEIKPLESNVFGKMFKENLDTPEMNTSISVRTVTAPQRYGDTERQVEYFTGYDWVVEPGMDWANKHSSAGCESLDQLIEFNENQSMIISPDTAIQLMEDGLSKIDHIHSTAGMEAFESISDMLVTLKNSVSNLNVKKEIVCSTNTLSLF